jgi:3-oxoacyl-[acyl-carrier protein] reductase
MKLLGRCAIITGASHGLGKEIAKTFWHEGASLALCARDRAPLADFADRLQSRPQRLGQRIVTAACDVSRMADIERFIAAIFSAFPRFEILVNNAGIYGPIGPLEDVHWAEWVDTIQINLIGTVAMCRGAIPHLKASGYGKIINLSGGGAANPLPGLSAYAASKAAVVRFTETLAGELASAKIDVNAIAPGILSTRLTESLLREGHGRVDPVTYDKIREAHAQGGTPLTVPAEACVYLASAESDGITGRLIAAVWDPWQQLHLVRDALRSSDIYTLRRITPEDRNVTWKF